MLITEFHVRQALSVSCLCFVLVGCPLGIRFGHGSYLGAFALCFLPIGLLYYPLMFCGVKLACSGQLPAVVALWGANVATAVVGALLFRGPGTR